ncbi:hypothetical protein [Kitasatospora sp. NPDC056531]|uniref:hypothetical protein n=1 Tax=Kitasatospora sp. NPDC056531 TaxID=3345856 RepID=UPI0036C964FB
MTDQPRLFRLQRDHDVTGISGTGTVAHGVRWPDGTATIRWTGNRPSTVQWASIDDAIAIHGHGGHTRIEWAPMPIPHVVALLELVNDLREIDPDPCRYDQHGHCEEHAWFETERSCPEARAAELFAGNAAPGPAA